MSGEPNMLLQVLSKIKKLSFASEDGEVRFEINARYWSRNTVFASYERVGNYERYKLVSKDGIALVVEEDNGEISVYIEPMLAVCLPVPARGADRPLEIRSGDENKDIDLDNL